MADLKKNVKMTPKEFEEYVRNVVVEEKQKKTARDQKLKLLIEKYGEAAVRREMLSILKEEGGDPILKQKTLQALKLTKVPAKGHKALGAKKAIGNSLPNAKFLMGQGKKSQKDVSPGGDAKKSTAAAAAKSIKGYAPKFSMTGGKKPSKKKD